MCWCCLSWCCVVCFGTLCVGAVLFALVLCVCSCYVQCVSVGAVCLWVL